MDKDIGKILNLLSELKIDKNTLVIFTSDNGPMPGEIFTDYLNSNGPLRGGKRDMYEGGLRIPFIAWWPGKIKPNTSSDHISAFWDFLPTACDLAGIEIPVSVDGISYLPTLLGTKQKEHAYLYWESPLNGFMTAVREGRWKAVQPDFESSYELYDLSNDIGENKNLASDYPEIIEKIESIVNDSHLPSEYFPRPDEMKK
jgi:arylsulfatase A-like enzyme